MASPSSFEGLSKSQIKKRLEEMRKQYELMQKKLEKSEKAARSKSHVKKKIADYKLKQSRGGSPECTLKGAHQQDVELSSSPTTSRIDQSTGLDTTHSRKTNSKRRSVSFHLAERRDQSAKSKKELGRLTITSRSGISTLSGEGSNHDADSHDSPVCFVHRTGNLFDDEVTTGEDVISQEFREEKEQPVVFSSPFSEVCSRNSLAGALPKGSVETIDDRPPFTNSYVRCDLSQEVKSPKVVSTEKDVCLQSAMRTTPEDTQFDLFADTDVPLASPETIEVSSGSSDSHGNAPKVKLVKSNVSAPLETIGLQHGNEWIVKNMDAMSISTDEGLDQASDPHYQGPMKFVPDSNNHSDTVKRSDLGVNESNPSENIILGRSAVESFKESTKQSVSVSQSDDRFLGKMQDKSENGSSNSSTEDPDIIPGTYSEEVRTLPRDAPLVTRRNQNVSDTALKRDGLSNTVTSRSIESQSSVLKQPQTCTDSSILQRDTECTVTSLDKQVFQEMKENSCKQVVKELSDEHDNNPLQQDPHEIEIIRTNDIAIHASSTASRLDAQTCDTVPDNRGKSKGRRKSQKSIDNLSMNDVSLKDFVLSQQSSQEGSHTWIDGLMYPAEYYVRKTRSMSRYSPKQHSAPTVNQEHHGEQSRSKSVEKAVFSEPLNQDGSCKFVNASETEASRETISSLHTESSSFISHEPCILSSKARKDLTSSGKIKVSRKPVAAQRRRGRKSITRKKGSVPKLCEINNEKSLKSQDVVQNQAGIVTGSQDVKGCADSQGIDDTCEKMDQTTPEESAFTKTSDPVIVDVDAEVSTITEKLASTQASHNPLESQFTQTQIPNEFSMPRVFGSPGAEIRNVRDRLVSTQAKPNPLESQFTQTQIPSEFALPTVFGSPGNQRQTPIGLSLGSPSSPSEATPGNAIGSPLEAKVISHIDRKRLSNVYQEGTNDVQLQDLPEQQWESQAYLEDVVPEAADPEPSADQSSIHAIGTALFKEDHDQESPSTLQEQICDVASSLPQGLHGDILRGSQNSDVSMVSMSQENAKSGTDGTDSCKRPVCPLPEDHFQVVPDVSCKLNLMAGALSDGTADVPSSLCSNVDQGSPIADAATGTPPEVAVVPLVQSQCNDSMRFSSRNYDFLQEDEIPEGEIDVRRRSVFQFRGCLEHKEEGTFSIKSMASSSVVINGTTRGVTTVQFPGDLFIWIQDADEGGQEFKLLSSWRTAKVGEEIHLVHPYSKTDGYFEAIIIVRDDCASESIRLIRFEVEQGTWEENVVLTSADLGQRACTALCVIPGRWIAAAVNNASGGSDVVYSEFDELCQRQTCEVGVLPAADTSLNSLTVVESAPDMIVGLTDAKAYLWHLPSGQLVQEFSLVNYHVTNCIQATAESGLLFLVAYEKGAKGHSDKQSEARVPSCCLLALNPATGRSFRLLNYTAPCFKPGPSILDISVREGTLAACLSSGHICLWDLFSSELLLSSHSDCEDPVSLVSLQDTGSLLLGSGHCIQIFEREAPT